MIDLTDIDPDIEYRELGYEIFPIEGSKDEGHFAYPKETVLELPVGAVVTKVMSQRDSWRWKTFDDILRIYALVPANETATEKHTFFVHQTGETFKLPKGVTKIDTIKEYEGQWVFHVYHLGPVPVNAPRCTYPMQDGGPCNISERNHSVVNHHHKYEREGQ